MKEFIVTYYGLDKEILPAMEKECKTYIKEGNKIYFNHVQPDEKHQNLCELMVKPEIELLLIDLSITPDIDSALRILYYEIHVKKINIVGLWNQVENPNLSKWRFELGIQIHLCYQIRDIGSIESLLLALTRLLNIAKEEFSFYKKPLNQPLNIFCPIRINFFDTENAQIESDIPLKNNELISCFFSGLPDFPFKEFKVHSITKINLNYPLENQGNLDYCFYDDFEQLHEVKWDTLDEIEFLELYEKNPVVYQNLDENQVREILNQFAKNKALSHSKKLIIKRMIDKKGKLPDYDVFKNLLIDKSFSTFKSAEEVLWQYPYKFFLLSTIEDNLNILNTCASQIITYVCKEKLNIDNFEDSEEFIQLKTICSRLNNLKERSDMYLPYILIYNLDIESSKLAKILDYPKLTVKNSEYDFKDNLEYNKQISSSPEYQKSFNFYQNKSLKVYPRSISEVSRGFLIKEVELLSISENEVIFKSNLPFQKETSFMFQLQGNLNYFANIYEIKKSNDENIYHGIINSLNETEKTELRKLIIKG